jgi:alpha-ribazole phosphatase
MTGEIVLVRHGRTALNAAGRLQGHVDEPLDDVGREQARRLAARLVPLLDEDDVVISSPLVRARDTAAVLGREARVDERWIEMSYGVFDGVPQGDVAPEVWAQWRSDPHFAPDGGESLMAVTERVHRACDDLRDLAADRRVVVVSHVSPIKAAIAWALGTDPTTSWRMHLDTAAVTRISVTRRGVALVSFNETHHLATDPD